MFKKCTKSICPTSSIINEPNSKKVSVLHHSKPEKCSGNLFSNQGTNLWLKNGGTLPLVSVDLTSSFTPKSSKHEKKSLQTVKSNFDLMQRHKGKKEEKHLSGKTPSARKAWETQVSHSLCSEHDEESKRDPPFVIDKENYVHIIVSHFNEQSHSDDYNPDEFCETKTKTRSPSSTDTKRTLQASTPPENVQYSEKAKADLLLAIREELRLWKGDMALSDYKVLGE